MEELKDKRVKIVFKDGNKTAVVIGKLIDFYFENKYLKLIPDKGTDLFINVNTIDKIEVIQ